MDGAFVFNEVTNNFQSVTIQGQLTYRIHDPRRGGTLVLVWSAGTSRDAALCPLKSSPRVVFGREHEPLPEGLGISAEGRNGSGWGSCPPPGC
jgi:hypothetical protein